MKFTIDQFVLDNCFNRIEYTYADQDTPLVYYWRECVERNGMRPDEVGYIVVYPDGEHLHTYHYPPTFLPRNKTEDKWDIIDQDGNKMFSTSEESLAAKYERKGCTRQLKK